MADRDIKKFTTIIVITPKDFPRLVRHYKRLVANIPSERFLFISGDGIEEELVKADLGDNVSFVNENELLAFDNVRDCMSGHLKSLLGNEPVPRGAVGWYYQQFLKMEYSRICEDEYYMTWDGDTIPCAPFSMFQEGTDAPYLDLKQEYHALYFETLEKLLPGMRKVIGQSFISEHMLFNARIMKELIAKIEENDRIPGKKYWEKIIHAIRPEHICDSAFSEFETYGTYVAFTDPDLYKLREWHSFRLAASFFDPDTISDRDFEWLAKDFHAISFEKNQFVREDNKNLFDNPEYQKKLSARQMLEIAQEEFKGGYIEVWGNTGGNVGFDPLSQNKTVKSTIPEDLVIAGLGNERLEKGNVNQAYLCFEQAAFLCDDEARKNEYRVKMEGIKTDLNFSVKPASICIVSYNAKKYMEECIRSIKFTCPHDSYEIVVVDNASTDGVTDYLKSIADDLTLVVSDRNLGFPGGCNCCIKYSKPDNDIFLLNNDTRLTHNALFWLRYGLYESDDIGAAGCMGSFAGNNQMVNLGTDNVAEIVEYARKNNVISDNPYEEKSRLCGFAMIIRRSVLNKVGLLDEAFTPGYYEDDDLSVRIREAGYRQIVVHNSFIYHKGSESFNSNPDSKKQQELNKLLIRNHEYSKNKNGYDNLFAAAVFQSELNVLSELYKANKRDFSLLEINCGSGNFLSHVKYLFPEAEIYGTTALKAEKEHSVKNIPISIYKPGTDDNPYKDMCFDYVIVRVVDYGEGIEKTPGYITPEMAKELFAGIVKEKGKLLYLTD